MKSLIRQIGTAEILHDEVLLTRWQFESTHIPSGATVVGTPDESIAGWTVPELIAIGAVKANCGETVAYDLARQLARGAK